MAMVSDTRRFEVLARANARPPGSADRARHHDVDRLGGRVESDLRLAASKLEQHLRDLVLEPSAKSVSRSPCRVPRSQSLLTSRPGRIERRRPGDGWSIGVRFDSQSIVHCRPELLFASQIAFGGLNRNVPQQKLDLVQFPTREVTQSGACAPEVVGR